MNRAELHHRVFIYSLLLLAAALPLHAKLVNISIGVLCANWIFEGGFQKKFQLIKEPLILVLLVFYLMHLIGVTYSENAAAGWYNLEKKFTLFIFPIVIGTSLHPVKSKWIDWMLAAFAAGCFLYSSMSLAHGIYLWQTQDTTQFLFGEELTDWGGLQSIYFGMYVAFAAAILMYFLVTRKLSAVQQATILLVVGYFFIFMIVMSARMGTLTFIAIVAAGGLYYAVQRKALKWFFISGLVLAITGSVLVFKVHYLRDRVMSIVDTKFYFDPNENNANGLTLRLVKWQCSLRGWATDPVIGVGTGDMQDVLQVCYKEKEFWGAVFEFNSHNQYLQTALGLGIVGLLALLMCFIYPAIRAFKQKHFLYLAFIVVISMAFLTESVLERKQGVLFFAFFHSLFIFSLTRPEPSQQ